ncbi:MAG: thioesterase [SAR202 cluster bacterium]|nr:thioesterase [SAR202 cluster bacterium]
MATDKLKVGMTAVVDTVITKDLSTNRIGRPGAEVLSTPSLLKLMELASMQATDSQIPDTHTSVGYAVDEMRHLAPAAMGATVTVKAVVTAIDKNKISYTIEAHEGGKLIGKALHKRAIIPKDPPK